MNTAKKLEVKKKLRIKYNKSIWKMKDTELSDYTIIEIEPSDGAVVRVYESGTNLENTSKKVCRLHGIEFKDYEVDYIEEPRVISSR